MALKDFFKSKQVTGTPAPTSIISNPTTAPAIPGISGGLAKQQGQTYNNWGFQICSASNGALTTLQSYMQCAYNFSFKEQSTATAKIDAMKQQLQSQIAQEEIALQSVQDRLKNAQNDLKQKQDDINNLKQADYEPNKEARMKLIIGCVILTILTVYLFLFYSSTFYSAFFKDFTNGGNLFEAMFDAQAIPLSFKKAFFQGMFVICAPIIFLALGFVLHIFSKQEGIGKWLKSGAVVIVTFAFDCILAYKIGHALYEVGRITGEVAYDAPAYSIGLAFTDTNIWAVIFCGFIVYIIWGLVFDMSMDAYSMLDANKVRINSLKNQINDLQQLINKQDGVNPGLLQQEANLKQRITSLENKLNGSALINFQIIVTDVTSFLAGWMNCMAILGLPKAAQDQANRDGMAFISNIGKTATTPTTSTPKSN